MGLFDFDLSSIGNTLGNFLSFNRSYTLPKTEQYKDNQGVIRNNVLSSVSEDKPFTVMDGLYMLGSPLGEGKNAMSLGEMGLSLWSLKANQDQFERQLEEARKQYEYQKNLTGANFQTQATGSADQALWNLQRLAAFNSNAAMERGSDLNQAFNQIIDAGNRIGVNNVIGGQQQQLINKYIPKDFEGA